MDFYFRDSMHRKFFGDFLKVLNLESTEKKLFSALYLICGSREFELLGRYIDTGRRIIHLEIFIDSEEFLNMDYPDQELSRLAGALYAGLECDVNDCFSQFKGPELKIALTALELRYQKENTITD
ncbi:hypothetical protein [Candidatus Contubernalis alkaliaceticus]|uniref:hypothetical protein n=1 Tax=Candidatus Contubernalis alkaliaceticus TaxID=338645 RepID=UPI001F4BEBBE|nr:hypothetical protein [Candidatus Contubernalis alkalaceticus]UNC91592.1 hypothetical protein HUE98_05510 [Candidatus Contubernalis alkalaceticus]